MPSSVRTTIYDRIWTLLEAHAPFTAIVLAGNRIKQTTDGWLRERMRIAPNDFPFVSLTAGRLINSSVFTETLSFNTENVEFTDLVAAGAEDWLLRRTFEFTITIEGGWVKLSDIDPIEEAAHVALLKGGPKLGIQAVEQWGPVSSTQNETDVQERSQHRLRTVIRIPVTVIQSGAALIEE